MRLLGHFEEVSDSRRYPSDLSDACWALVEPPLTSWRTERARHGLNIGHAPRRDLRNVLDAVLYVVPRRHPLALPPA
ncbi:hypothetical protein C6Y14_11975 [Streptomyces dioscori]|uniref:Transposase n=1 Tax=Streptomyces dioscori TaxID=2109333 RepID=A0A2P8Q9G8_9ACTN|nr:hypothetical protein C6Y14_11975 [Streptomyces dioscori]